MIDAIREVPYYGRGIHTAEGLRVVDEEMLTIHQGWREDDIPTVVVVLTDGKAKDWKEIPRRARRLRRKVTRVIAVGIGNADENELRQIASRPAEDNVIQIADFGELSGLVLSLAEKVGFQNNLIKISYCSNIFVIDLSCTIRYQ